MDLQESKSRIFSERVILLGPLISIGIFLLLNSIVFTSEDLNIPAQLYVMDYIFINKVHTIIGLFLFFTLAETVRVHNSGIAIKSEFTAIYVIVFLFFCASSFNREMYDSLFYLIPYVFLTKWIPNYHNFYQSHGICLLYFMKMKPHLSESDRKSYENILIKERKIGLALIIGSFITPDVGYKFLFRQVEWPPYFFEIGVSVQIIALVLLLFFSYRKMKILKNVKVLLYDLRYLLYPLASVSIVAFCAIRVNHGIEYIFTLKHILKHSETPMKVKKMMYMLIPAIAIVYSGIFLGREIEKFLTGEISFVGTICFNLALTINIIHFYFDGKMFRMKDKIVRNNMGRVLVEN